MVENLKISKFRDRVAKGQTNKGFLLQYTGNLKKNNIILLQK